MDNNAHKMQRLGLTFIAYASSLVVASALTFTAAVLPEILFVSGVEVIIDANPQTNAMRQRSDMASDFRLSLTSHYFNWAIISITMCGAIIWRLPAAQLSLLLKLLIGTAFLLCSLSVLLGTGYLELSALGLARGFPMLETEGFLRYYPTAQFCTAICGFLLASQAALVAAAKIGSGSRQD